MKTLCCLIAVAVFVMSGCSSNNDRLSALSWAIGEEDYILQSIKAQYEDSRESLLNDGWTITNKGPAKVMVGLTGRAVRVWWIDQDDYTEVGIDDFDGSFSIKVSIASKPGYGRGTVFQVPMRSAP